MPKDCPGCNELARIIENGKAYTYSQATHIDNQRIVIQEKDEEIFKLRARVDQIEHEIWCAVTKKGYIPQHPDLREKFRVAGVIFPPISKKASQ